MFSFICVLLLRMANVCKMWSETVFLLCCFMMICMAARPETSMLLMLLLLPVALHDFLHCLVHAHFLALLSLWLFENTGARPFSVEPACSPMLAWVSSGCTSFPNHQWSVSALDKGVQFRSSCSILPKEGKRRIRQDTRSLWTRVSAPPGNVD